MKFKKGFGIVLEPDYNIKEKVSEEEQREKGNYWEVSEDNDLSSGGSFRWTLATITDRPIQEEFTGTVPVQLMRLWAVQMTSQLIDNNAHVELHDDEPKFNITNEEKKVIHDVLSKLYKGLNESLEDSAYSVVTKRMKKFNFNEND
jgi:hypothetical protein|tara:strand:- start:71 stop:508 length:438 start_codon:yes stop_codon:yes gene_type:complete